MSEVIKPVEQMSEANRSIVDSLQLAFENIDFEQCESEDLPYAALDDVLRVNCKMRQKRDFDALTRMPLIVTHYRYDALDSEGFTPEEHVCFEWGDDDDDNNLTINMHTFEIGYYIYNLVEDTDIYYPIDRSSLKVAQKDVRLALEAVM